MGEYKLLASSRITFQPLTTLRRMNDVLLGYEAADKYLSIEEEGLAIINALRRNTISQVEKQFPEKDVQGFVTLLANKGFVYKIDHRVIAKHAHIGDLLDISHNTAKILTYPFFKGLGLSIILLGIYLLITQPQLVPKPQWLLVTAWYGVLVPLLFIAWWIIVFLHEFAKYVALKSTGHNTRMHIVHKWHLLLPHTSMSSARMLKSTEQAKILFSGLWMNALIIGICTILLLIPIAPAIVQFILAITFINFLLELVMLPRTDLTEALDVLYNTNTIQAVLATVQSACIFCRNKLPKQNAQQRAAGGDLLPVAIIGLLLGIGVLLAFIVPLLQELLVRSIHVLITPATHIALFTDSVITILFIAVFAAFLFMSLIRHHHLNVHDWFAWLCMLFFTIALFVAVLTLSIAFVGYTSPVIAAIVHLILGVIFGSLFIQLMEIVHVEELGFAKDFFLPILAALTAVLLVFVVSTYAALTGIQHPQAVYGIAYGVGMLSAMVL